MSRKSDKYKDDGGAVVGRFVDLRFTIKGLYVTLNYPYKYFWNFIPGKRIRRSDGKGLKFNLPNVYTLTQFLEIMKSLPLNDPVSYPFDFDTTYSQVRTTKVYFFRACLPVQNNFPITIYRKYKTSGNYSTEVLLPKDTKVL